MLMPWKMCLELLRFRIISSRFVSTIREEKVQNQNRKQRVELWKRSNHCYQKIK